MEEVKEEGVSMERPRRCRPPPASLKKGNLTEGEEEEEEEEEVGDGQIKLSTRPTQIMARAGETKGNFRIGGESFSLAFSFYTAR